MVLLHLARVKDQTISYLNNNCLAQINTYYNPLFPPVQQSLAHHFEISGFPTLPLLVIMILKNLMYSFQIIQRHKLKITMKGKRKENLDSTVVGPGSYTYDAPRSGRKYGFGDRFLQTYETDTPGPNYYNCNTSYWKQSSNKKDGFMLSTSKQDTIYPRSQTPAPNQYETSGSQPPLNQTFTKGPREAYYLDTPGPGSYHQEPKGGKGFSFLAKYKACPPPNFPGPGQYDVRAHKISNGTIKFNQIKRETIFSKIKDESPGPGAYIQTTSESKKGIKFNNAQKIFDYSTKVPGPGKYEADNQNLSKKGGVICKLYRPVRFNTTPGPGQYNLEYQQKEDSNSRWSQSKRFKDLTDNILGPGSYSVEKQLSQTGVSFTKQKNKREPISKTRFEPPGPGEYENNSDIGYIPGYLTKKKQQ